MTRSEIYIEVSYVETGAQARLGHLEALRETPVLAVAEIVHLLAESDVKTASLRPYQGTEYTLAISEASDGWVAAIVDYPGEEITSDMRTPIRGWGKTPKAALAQLHECLLEWPRGGASRWLDSAESKGLRYMFCPTYKVKGDKPSS